MVFCAVLCLLISGCNSDKSTDTANARSITVESKFMGSFSCKECHEEQFATWENSHHDQAMKIADSISVLADFNNTSFKNQKVNSIFFKEEGDFYVKIVGALNESIDF